MDQLSNNDLDEKHLAGEIGSHDQTGGPTCSEEIEAEVISAGITEDQCLNEEKGEPSLFEMFGWVFRWTRSSYYLCMPLIFLPKAASLKIRCFETVVLKLFLAGLPLSVI